MSLTTLRESIRATRDVIYMNTGFTGPSPEPVLQRMREAFEYEATVGPASVEGLAANRQLAEDTRATVASLFNGDPDEVAITHGTTEGMNVVIYGMDWKPGDEFVSCALEHPALATPCQVLAERYGATVKAVDVAANATAAEALAAFKAAITPQTKLVAISHVQYSCGLKLPLKEIIDAAHAAGTLVAVDGAQTGGQLALDVQALGVDFYSISGQKWVLGPNGTGALWVKREHIRNIEPLFTTNAIADTRALPGDGPGGGNPLMRFRIASQSPALTAGFGKAISLLQEIGMEEVEAHCAKLGDRLRARRRRHQGRDPHRPHRPGRHLRPHRRRHRRLGASPGGRCPLEPLPRRRASRRQPACHPHQHATPSTPRPRSTRRSTPCARSPRRSHRR